MEAWGNISLLKLFVKLRLCTVVHIITLTSFSVIFGYISGSAPVRIRSFWPLCDHVLRYIKTLYTRFKTRFREHAYLCRKKKIRIFLYNHIRKSDHNFKDVSGQPVEHKLTRKRNATNIICR